MAAMGNMIDKRTASEILYKANSQVNVIGDEATKLLDAFYKISEEFEVEQTHPAYKTFSDARTAINTFFESLLKDNGENNIAHYNETIKNYINSVAYDYYDGNIDSPGFFGIQRQLSIPSSGTATIKSFESLYSALDNFAKILNNMIIDFNHLIDYYKELWNAANGDVGFQDCAHEAAENIRNAVDTFGEALNNFATNLEEQIDTIANNTNVSLTNMSMFNFRNTCTTISKFSVRRVNDKSQFGSTHD